MTATFIVILKLFIMSRVNHVNSNQSKSSNPTKQFLGWKSKEKSFSYYDKEKGENISVSLPFKFLFLQHYHTVKGWHDASESGIYSNEVFYIGSESLNVRSFKGKQIANGLYKDIKPDVIASGGKYHRSIYVMLEDGTLANLSFKGACVKEWSDFMETNKHLVDSQWIEVLKFDDKKKGSVSYSTPVFTLGKNLTKAESLTADDTAAVFQEYIDDYFSGAKKPALVENIEVDVDEIGF